MSQLKKSKLRLLAEIYFTFLKLGSVSFGGGYAMISLIEREIVNEKKWVEKEKIIDIFAVSESLPGAIALNSSAFVGRRNFKKNRRFKYNIAPIAFYFSLA